MISLHSDFSSKPNKKRAAPASPKTPPSVPRVESLQHRLLHAKDAGGQPVALLDELLFFLDDPPPGTGDRWQEGADLCAEHGIIASRMAVWRFYRTQSTQEQPQQHSADAEAIYSPYPRKVAKPTALKAIDRALKSVSAEVLKTKTGIYAKAVTGTDLKFVPHPATWFSQQRFNDPEKNSIEMEKPSAKNSSAARHMTLRRKHEDRRKFRFRADIATKRARKFTRSNRSPEQERLGGSQARPMA